MDNKKNFENSNDTVMRTVLLMSLLKNEKYTAAELAEILNCSVRHVHRMINGLKAAGIKMKIKRGRFGGFKIVDDRFHISGQLYLETLKKLKND
jgi:predicted DNA-binding transcriptional regulator YafY